MDPTPIRPDRAFLERLRRSGGEDLKRCFQCATCSVVCDLSPQARPFPRKEMLWAQWGLKERLVADMDLWLCHECQDCTERCPRGARPGDVMAALRRESMLHYVTPGFLRDLFVDPSRLVWLLLVPSALLGAAVLLWPVLEGLLPPPNEDGALLFSFWALLPRRLLIAFFALQFLFSTLVLTRGLWRFGCELGLRARQEGQMPVRGVASSAFEVLRDILSHDTFGRCTSGRPRRVSHMLVLYGFLGLILVDLWVLLAPFNPLLEGLVYPFNFWNPWKILANLSGLAATAGCLLMLSERWRLKRGAWYDHGAILLLLVILLSGFCCEALHLLRQEPWRQVAYLLHLIPVSILVLFLPFSKLAHALFRTVALVQATRLGREPRSEVLK